MAMEAYLPSSPISTGLVALVAGLFSFWLFRRMRYNYPPRPGIALPLLGHAYKITFNDLYLQAFEWSKVYGPVLTVHLGPMKMVVVNKIDEALEVLVKKSTDFANRLITPSVEMFTDGGRDIVFSNYSPTWKLHRKLSSKALRHYMQGPALEQRVHTALETALAEMDGHADSPFDPIEHINFIVGNILTGLCFGGSYVFEDKEVNFILEQEDLLLSDGLASGTLEDFLPPIRHVYKSQGFRRLEQFYKDIIEDFIGKKYYEEKKTFKRDELRHLVDHLILARMEAEESEGDGLVALTDTRIIQTLSDIFFAGVDTSRMTLRFALLHMAAYPDIQAKAYEEIDRVVGRGRLPGLSDRPDLAYTEAVLHESMRIATVLPSGVWHETLCDTSIGSYKIPKGTPVMINHWALHHDPDAWDEVEKFKPERYLDEHGKLGPKPKSWLPFGAGKRVCLGEFVAKPELHLIFASLLQRYRWSPEAGRVVDISPERSLLSNIPKSQKLLMERRI
ncbi:steroid 17-alpha-hydroxylase/17,20 lyase-like [Mya arenaria]|uniref:steroid 17-alpha-hydroxylase/17,20 lyase-like n=1 Tax=Mya arenaria TaxID=6604 RepID=UPI0022E465AA|nr:steroid 17-alpha-hydroxylase/17,20 lyase-like [Mya arenaria]XP_052815705.1 steroid 17-alpha-hydroxylase/17,20 lyase-like [Mya arenaria]